VQGAWSLAALLLVGPLVAYLVSAIEHHLVGSLVAIAAVLAWPVACYAAFRALGWHLQMVPPVLAGGAALVVALRFQVGWVDAQARQVRRTFQRYVSAAIVEEMLRHPERVTLGGERREMTVLFSDIRGFTTLAESLDSEQVVRLLNEFFTPMTRLVLDAGGTLDKYMGDALMAFFGAPVAQTDHAERACAAALSMRDELARLNAGWQAGGRFAPGKALGIGIGLNSGPMSVGNMGSDQIFDYTVIGDEVNLGSRVEGLNKLYGTEVLVTGATAAAAEGAFLFRELDRVRVKGKSEAVALFELLARRPAPPETEARATAFAEALALYRNRDFATAAEAFGTLAEEHPDDGPASVFAERSRRFAVEPPPAEWDAVETLTSK
jgi:adenylate cyclase